MTSPKIPASRRRKFLHVVLWGTAILFFVVASVPAILSALSIDFAKPQKMTWELQVVERVWFLAIGLLFSIWLFFVGGCVASFLNVVAWRLPQKRSILGGSACPNCGQGLTFRENLPFIGWLNQEGISKCCRQPIPSRYFWVEVFLGSIFVLLGALEIAFLGTNFPKWYFRAPSSYFDISALAIAILTSHLVLVSLLFTFSLFRFEGAKIPWSLLIFGIVCFVIKQVLLANPQWFGVLFVVRKNSLELITIQLGLTILAAFVLGQIISMLERWWLAPSRTEISREIIFSLLLIGMLGEIDLMVMVVATYVIVSIPLVLSRQVAKGDGWMAPSNRFLLATLFHLVFWRQFNLGDLPNRVLEIFKG